MMEKLFGLLLLALLLLAVIVIKGGALLSIRNSLEETLDHPDPRARRRYRVWSWTAWYSVSLIVFSLPLCLAVFDLSGDYGFRPLPMAPAGILFFAIAIPGAILLSWLNRRFSRWINPARRAARRRLGLPGYRVPVKLQTPPVPVAFPIGARPDAAPVPSADVEGLDDPDLAREAARKHWDAITFAIASGGDVAAAQRRQQAFLDQAEHRLSKEALARLQEAYAQESVPHAARMAAVARRQTHEREEQDALRARVHRRLLVIGAAGFILTVLRFCTA